MSKKIIRYAIVVVWVIFVGILIGKNIVKDEKTVETSKNYNNITNENKVVNEIAKVENKIENVITNSAENTEIKNDIAKEELDSETKEDTNEENKIEKAIDIAKKDWGTDDSVYFEFDQIKNNGNYVIAVRQKTTTKAIFWYTIDVDNEKIID